MKYASKILGLGCLIVCALAWVELSSAQNPGEQNPQQVQQQNPSTPDLESQPNVNQYPQQVRRRRGFPPPTPQPVTNPDPPPNPDLPPATVQPNNSPQPSSIPQAQPVPSSASGVANRRSHAAHTETHAPGFIQPSPGFIGPPSPQVPTLEQMAPTPPKITYQNGLLSVESVNSRLIDVLNGIRSKAGIQFEGIQSDQDRVAGRFGPAPADQVLTTLLQGTHFDYVIIGTPENPSVVQRVILTPSTSTAAAAGAPGAAQPAQDASGDDDDNSAEDSSDTAEQMPVPQQVQQPGPGGQNSGAPQNSGGPKTAEQLLQELKQMQQNQQPQQQNLPPAPIKQPRGPG